LTNAIKNPRWLGLLALAATIWFAGCSPIATRSHRRGPKVNILHFTNNPATYQGKTISLILKMRDTGSANQDQFLRDYVGKNVTFTARASKDQQLNIVITLPANLSIPDVRVSDEVRVVFTCTRGSLQQGNEAKSIESP
jgi:hypothetical protein